MQRVRTTDRRLTQHVPLVWGLGRSLDVLLRPSHIAVNCGDLGVRIRWGHWGAAPQVRGDIGAVSQESMEISPVAVDYGAQVGADIDRQRLGRVHAVDGDADKGVALVREATANRLSIV